MSYLFLELLKNCKSFIFRLDFYLQVSIIRKAKRKAEGFTDPENVVMAKAQLKEKQKDLREFIEQTNAEEGTEVLRRDSGRDKDALSKLIRIQALLRPTKLSTANGIDLTAITPCRYVVIVISH